MATVTKFNRDMIKKYLDKRDTRYLRDSDGDFRVDFERDEDIGREISIWFMAQGEHAEIYSVLMKSDKRLSKPEWDHTIPVCNTWNLEKRWPKAYLAVKDPEKDTIAEIFLEGQIDLEKGIHLELFEHYTDSILAAGVSFWVWAKTEHGL